MGMRITEQVVDNEGVISGWLAAERGWTVWHDDRSKRERHVPTFVAVHLPSRTTLAIFARPRRLHPSELPAADWLPDRWIPCVWWPGMHIEVRAWLAAPVVDP